VAFTAAMALPDVGPMVERGPQRTEEVPALPPVGPPRRRPSPRAIALSVLVVAVLAGGGTGLGVWLFSGSGSPSAGATVTTQVVSVSSGTMQQTVTSSGTLEPSQTADLDFAVPGTVTAVDVSTGQQVSAGQALATVGATALEDQLSAAQESLDSAEARLSEDQSAGAAASQLDSDQAAVTSAENDVASAQTALGEATLTSTISGTVASVALGVGQQVTGSGGTGTASTGSGGTGTGGTGTGGTGSGGTGTGGTGSSAEVVVVSTDSFVVDTTVDDTQVGQVKNGDQAVIVPSGSTTDVYGTVSTVGLIASSTSGVASFPVTIAVTGTPSGLYAGTTASVSIVVQQIDDAVQVPSAAISYDNGQPAVTELVDGRHVTRDVTTGVSANGDTQITSGVSPGEKVLERVVTFKAPSGSAASSLFGGRRFSGGGGAFVGGGLGGTGAFGGQPNGVFGGAGG